ncbi:MAG: hypothetical protein DI624_01605 [Brevundimonas sp.]|uniref:hypothetical protein n=1 Tax=Brevundimonas sp. TaxID=1871086 RepID=UPI000DB53211|nr:hypothetical protein [Brevundimonas sp.]PZU00981.1 MAG: hypothetical protein DI624_01605 [Brevundimonas sp.]
MTQPLSTEELMRLEAELAECTAPLPGKRHPRPHPSLPEVLAPGSNVAYPSSEENARLVQQALALGLGHFARMSFDDTHRLAARMQRR